MNIENKNKKQATSSRLKLSLLAKLMPPKNEIQNVILNLNRVICRLLAIWCLYISTTLDKEAGFLKLEFNQTESISTLIIWLLVGFIVLSVIAFFLHKYNTDSWFLWIGATACIIWWSLSPPSGNNAFLFWLSVGTAYALFLIWILHENLELLEKIRLGRKTIIIVGASVGITACVIISVITCLRYKTFSSPNYDFGIFVNMFHNMKETGLPYVTCERDILLSHFAVHISPIYYLFLPFYILFPSPYTLQIGQAVVLMLGVVPIILLSKHYKLSNKATILFSALYVFYTAISMGCFYDIHENCFLTLFLLLTFLFFEKGKTIPMYLCAFLVLGVKEDAAVYLIVFALYIFFSRKKRIQGISLFCTSIIYFCICAIVLEKFGLGMMIGRYSNLILNSEDGLIGAIKTVFLNPGYILTQLFSTTATNFNKVIYFFELLLPLGFMPFCTKKASRWILLTPLLLNLLTMYVYQYEIDFQYSFGISAFLFYAAIQNVADVSPTVRKNIITIAFAFCICLYTMLVLSKLGYYVQGSKDHSEEHKRMEEILEMVPEDASVCCSTFLLPHMADRSEIYEVAYHEGKCDIDYVVLDARYSSYKTYMELYINQGYEELFYEESMIMILASPDLSSE